MEKGNVETYGTLTRATDSIHEDPGPGETVSVPCRDACSPCLTTDGERDAMILKPQKTGQHQGLKGHFYTKIHNTWKGPKIR